MTSNSESDADAVQELVATIGPILHGHSPGVQSGALADLTAMWLAGHQDLEHPESAEILELREALFAEWCATVLKLVPVNVAMVRAKYLGDRN